MSKRMLVAKEVRQDLAAAQRELQEALNTTDPAVAKARISAARTWIANAMRRIA